MDLNAGSPGVPVAGAVAVVGPQAPRFRCRITSGRHHFVADEPAARGGRDEGPTPFAYLVAALGGCTATTLRMYGEVKRWDLGTIEVAVELRRHSEMNYIERHVRVSAVLTEAQQAKLYEICEATPVTVAIKYGITIHTRLEAAQTDQA